MAQDHGEETLGILATASVFIGMAYTSMQDSDSDFTSLRRSDFDFLDLQRLSSTPADCGPTLDGLSRRLLKL